MNIHRQPRRAVLRAIAAAGLFAGASLAHAQGDWPQAGPIRFIVPFTAGSGTDVVARSLADKLGPILGAQIVVENKPGAGGTLGAAQVAKSQPDGYTLLIHSSGHLVNPAIYPNLSYDTLKDFEGITPLASLPNVLVVSPSAGYKNLADLVDKAKAQPGKLFYASAGNGSATHMNAEQFRVAANIEAVHVPFRGTPEAITETIAGRTTWFFAPLVSALPMIKDGKLQALAVGTASRAAALPDVPSMSDSGLPAAAYTFWVGLFAPAKTPQPVLDKIHAGVMKVLEMPDIKTRLGGLGATPMPMAQKDFQKYLQDETRSSAQLVKAAGIRIE
ncbi:Tripartite tricarboxylate transporter family receptor [Pigmentiphaga humi]|uniref:Tripartite tricarboxylate transporter family receptor n=1 Tax=Pigmentiphaga humi TaxID=2478468 RepID=A0A3P4B073_9BURK|nr:tripartite tricarboxylate transporter substrate binding protein [Pigmentiphaga humi]VCU69697.1 Tripartite tricarboxylate transporter family receptor [Pigmentiphaga humi]